MREYIYWEDLTPEAQERLRLFYNGEESLATIELKEDRTCQFCGKEIRSNKGYCSIKCVKADMR